MSLPKVTRTYQNHLLDSTRWNHYRPRNDDVIVATPYKSGTTWTLEILRQLIFLRQEAPPFKEFWVDARFRPIEGMAELEAQQHRRYIKTHLALDGLPFFPQVKYIVVGRDARDVFMSMWNHYANFTEGLYPFLNSLPDRVGEPLPVCPENIHIFWHDWITRGSFAWESEGYPFWGNLHHVQSWWEYRHLDNILFVHFNDLLSNLSQEVQRIASFLEIDIPTEALPKLLQTLTLDAMRSEHGKHSANNYQAFKDGAKNFFFKGTNGRWKEVLSPDELVLYEQAVERVLTPDCANWLEQGRVELEHHSKPVSLADARA